MPTETSISVLRAYERQSRALVNIKITHPPTKGGELLMRFPSTPMPVFSGVRITATKAIRQGEEMTYTYGALRWASEAGRKAVEVASAHGARARAPVADLAVLIDTLIQRAPEDFAVEHGAGSLRELLGNKRVAEAQAKLLILHHRMARQRLGSTDV